MSRFDLTLRATMTVLGLFAACIHAQETPVPAQLHAALVARYPQVVRWEVTALDELAEPAAVPEPISVLKLGARSAVRGEGRIYWYSVRGYAPGLVAARFIEAGEPLSTPAMEPAEINLVGSGCEQNLVVAPAEWRARRRLSAGTPLCSDSIELMPAVSRGSLVTVRVVAAAVEISAKGHALRDGRIGERLRVRSTGSGEMLEGVVTGKGEVRIDANL